ncbi:hypothetical protein [Streptomyces adonidis]|uniref:hypothetical protein n=1 Tax=Streptomyces adonidis TaxID=3231367 RepID=UPI0034DADD60
MVRPVYDFTPGGRDLAGLLCGKDPNLAGMTRLSLPGPPGSPSPPRPAGPSTPMAPGRAVKADEVPARLAVLEQAGRPDDPLPLSVRSGARFSMPGTTETTEDAVAGLDRRQEATNDLDLNAAVLAGLVGTCMDLIRRETGDFPRSPAEALCRAVLAVFESLRGERARPYRHRRHTADDPCSAVG